ncbi:MAG TPA: YdcF family protein [Cytophagales bacterium]|jgi:uncharacterized SAM-binding protein YcdF (DUF218 family)|nr:YdcF family protein [Cytophagales bacterium]
MKTFKKIVKYVVYFHLFVIACAVLGHCTFQHYANTSYEAAKKVAPFDAVIVPGVPYEDTSTNIIYKARVLWAKHLYDSGFTKNIIFSGSAVYTPYIESRTMKLYAVALGVPESNVFTEEKAEHSSENVYYSWKLARQLGFKKIALATDPYQSGMLKGLIKDYTPGVMSLPIQFEKIQAREKILPRIDPSSAKVSPFVALPKREGFWERFRGTMGKRVKAEAKLDENKK